MKWLESLFVSIIAVFAPIQAAIFTVLALIAMDLFTGIFAAKKRTEKIKSSGMRRTISKLIVYETALMMGFLAETYLLYGSIPVVKLIAGMIAITELKSILENLDSIQGQSFFTALITKLGSDNDKK